MLQLTSIIFIKDIKLSIKESEWNLNTLNIGKKLKHLRKQNNLSQQDLADKLHRKRTSISAYEHDNIIPTLEILKQICEIYNISMDFLMDLSSPTLLKIPKKFITAEVLLTI